MTDLHPAGTGTGTGGKLAPTPRNLSSNSEEPFLNREGTRFMPRRSSAFFETLPHAAPSSPIPRLSPPATMSEPARKIFLDLVVGSKADAFRATDVPLLARYAEAAAMSERAEAEIARKPLVKGRPNPWTSILVQSTKTVSLMSMRLRLSPQARQPHNPGRGRVSPMSYYERMDFEKQLSDEDLQQ